jgi:hypothetical protein
MRIRRRRIGDCRLLLMFVCLAAGACIATPLRLRGADFVFHISVDGLRPDYLQEVINRGLAPNFKRFQTEGAWTNNARTDDTDTYTLANHTSMLTGRPVSQPAGMPNTTHHGYTDDGSPNPSWTLHNQGNPGVQYKASTFDVAHDAGLSTALFASKSKFVIYEQSYNGTTGALHPRGRDKIDTFYASGSTASMQSQLLSGLVQNHYNYTFVHYADPDLAGHSFGWGSTAYNNAVARIDGYLGSLFNLANSDATFAGRTAIILSTDHGGNRFGHGDLTSPLVYTIPFYAWGTGVEHGDLYAFNSRTRTNPGTTRPTYTTIGQPIRNGDGGNLALHLLGLGAIPGSLVNAAQDLHVTMQGPLADINGDNVVNPHDYQLLLGNMGLHLEGPLPPASGDLNFDGKIDSADFGIFKTEFPGGPAALEAALAAALPQTLLPEPDARLLASCAAGVLCFTRRHRVTAFSRRTRANHHLPLPAQLP